MRIAICGIHIESSTFTPYLSTESDFEVRRGTHLLDRYPFLTDSPVPGAEAVPDHLAGEDARACGPRPWNEGVEWIPILHARALPGGPIERETYEAWKAEICTGLTKAGDVDGVFFDIHGAMSTPGLDDAEGDLITAIRSIIGPEPLVGACMDLHGNVSHTLFNLTDLLTCYRMAPHEDAWVSRERAARTLVAQIRQGFRPAKALCHVPILLPGEKTSTRMQPAARLYDSVAKSANQPGLVDVSYWVGFAWADQPRCTAAIASYGIDETTVAEVTRALADDLWDSRHEFDFVAPTASIDDALTSALTSTNRPFFISDSGDNPGAGGAGDVTTVLHALLNRTEITSGSVSVIVASLYDPGAVEKAERAGVGGHFHGSVGGWIEPTPTPPVTIDARVTTLVRDPDGGMTAVLSKGGLNLIVTSRRNQYTMASQFARLGLEPASTDIVIVKIGYLEPDLFEMQEDWILALTPGGVDQDLSRLGHHHINRPMFPFDEGQATLRLVSAPGSPTSRRVSDQSAQ